MGAHMTSNVNEPPTARWLTPWRLNVYPRAALAAMVLAFIGLVFLSQDLTTPRGVPLGGDYPVFYGVASLVVSGDYSAVFDVEAVNASQAAALGEPSLKAYHVWVYPPYVALLLAPLSLVPYLLSYILFTILMTTAIWVGVCWLGRVSPWIAENRFTVFAAIASFYPMLRAATGWSKHAGHVHAAMWNIGNAHARSAMGRRWIARSADVQAALRAAFHRIHIVCQTMEGSAGQRRGGRSVFP